MEYYSNVVNTGLVSTFPEFTGERIYMEPFFQKKGLSDKYKRWNSVVEEMLDGVFTDLPIYLMVDQAEVKAGQYHRRSGLHIDGYWNPGGKHWWVKSCHGHKPPHHIPHSPPAHDSKPIHSANGDWTSATFEDKEAIILTSNISASRAFKGKFDGPILKGGDCSEVGLHANIEEIQLKAGDIYHGNVTMLHETLPCEHDSLRTVVRLNVPGYHPTIH